ncbi:MAG: NUDIX domain-containing protein [Marinilabiliaceae bacterium]|nr:NUDIX domain-containing protein [Marinilabiliaceae bacterium]
MDALNATEYYSYCPHCGSSNLKKSSDKSCRCYDCHHEIYFNAAAAVVAVIFNDKGEVLLTRRAHDPWKGMYDLPGGFVDPDESLETALKRELKEELDIDIDTFQYITSDYNKYPYSNVMIHTTDALFSCHLTEKLSASISVHDDVSEIIWFKPSDIPTTEIPGLSIRHFAEMIKEGKIG